MHCEPSPLMSSSVGSVADPNTSKNSSMSPLYAVGISAGLLALFRPVNRGLQLPGATLRRSGAAFGRLTASAAFEGDAGGFAVPGRGGHAVVAQLVLEDAADRVARQVVAEFDVARDGEVRDALDAP